MWFLNPPFINMAHLFDQPGVTSMRGSRTFRRGGGGGGPGQSDKKSSDNVFFFFFFFFSPQLILQKSNGQFQRNLSFFKVPEGVQHFPGGSNCLFPIETHITCDFPGGGPDPLSPLWIHTCPNTCLRRVLVTHLYCWCLVLNLVSRL